MKFGEGQTLPRRASTAHLRSLPSCDERPISVNLPPMQQKSSEIDLEAENLVLQLAYWSRLLITKRFGHLLHGAYHGRWTTNEDLNVRCWSRKPSFDHICCNESCSSVPLLRRVVQHVVDTEPVIFLCQLIKIFLKQNVIWIDVCKDQSNSSS